MLAVRDEWRRLCHLVVNRACRARRRGSGCGAVLYAFDLVRKHGEEGRTAHTVPLTVDGLIYASSMVTLDSARRKTPVPTLVRWLLGLGVVATLAANVDHGLIGAAVAVWLRVALAGSYELLVIVIRGS
jgi:hypothetical protein